jgi:1,4-dihydroxy-2-naphthoate octaprenyltransferase
VPFVFLERGFSAWCLLPVLLSPVAVLHCRRLFKRTGATELISLLGDTGKLLAGYAALFAVGINV